MAETKKARYVTAYTETFVRTIYAFIPIDFLGDYKEIRVVVWGLRGLEPKATSIIYHNIYLLNCFNFFHVNVTLIFFNSRVMIMNTTMICNLIMLLTVL